MGKLLISHRNNIYCIAQICTCGDPSHCHPSAIAGGDVAGLNIAACSNGPSYALFQRGRHTARSSASAPAPIGDSLTLCCPRSTILRYEMHI
jgi:hypothetical protein